MPEFSLDGYFDRIQYIPSPGEDPLTVFINLHVNHALHIPFENVDVYLKKILSLNTDDLYDKIVCQKRGGYCFEMNALFARVLRELGYQVTPALARLNGRGMGFGAHTHRVNIVTVDGSRWLADVGYGGGGCIAPVNLESREEQRRWGQSFRVHWEEELGFVVSYRNEAGDFCDYLSFFDIETPEKDFEIMSYFTNCHPDSGFRKALMCMLPLPNGRITLNGNTLRILKDGVKTEQELEDSQLESALKEYFGLQVSLSGQSDGCCR